MMARARITRSQRGVSLVELMVSLSLGIVLSFGVVNLFLNTKTSFSQDEQSAQLQENGRWALRYVARELSMTGFLGTIIDGEAVSTTLAVDGDCAAGWAADTGVAMEHLNDVTDAAATAAYSCLDDGRVQPGTDIIAVRRTKDTPNMLDGALTATPAADALYLRVEDFGASSTLVKGSALTSADKTPGSSVDFWEYQPQFLFIRKYSISDGDGVPALCRKRLTTDAATLAVGDTECLVDGIENLQVEFGLDLDNPFDYVPDYFTPTPTADQLETAVAARIYILSRSIDELPGYTNDKSYALGSTTVAAANDAYYRRVLQTTVMLRNSEAFGF